MLEVAVVYPHFLSLQDDPLLPTRRKFELRVVNCEFDLTTKARSKTEYPPLWTSISFDGDPAPNGVSSPGLVLPDLAPSDEDRAFWMVHERQKVKPQGIGLPQAPDGRIKLEYYLLEGRTSTDPGEWMQKASKTFQGSNNLWSWKRRPMISSFPDGSGQHVVSISFATVNSYDSANDTTSNVVYENWEYEGGSLISPPTYPGIALPIWDPIEFTNTVWLDRPVPLQGRTMAQNVIRRCYLTGNPPSSNHPTSLVHWNPYTTPGTQTLVDSDQNSNFSGIRRPAATYGYFATAAIPDYYAVTWEKLDINDLKRVYIAME